MVFYLGNYIFIPICLYSVTGAMFLPVFQSLIYQKVCYSLSNETGIYDCQNAYSKAAKEQRIHSTVNMIMLIASISMCLTGVLSSGIIGYISDCKSRKLALLIPFIGLLIADVTLLVQAYFVELSPFFFIISELIFGCFGGYMSIISSSFAYITSGVDNNPLMRSKSIARLEGIMGIGGMFGFLISSQLAIISYVNVCLLFLIVHTFCFFYVLNMREPKHKERSISAKDQLKQASSLLFNGSVSVALPVLFLTFGASYFAFVGTSHILFFYLKQRFYWDAEYFGYLRATTQACSTAMALFIYPFLKSKGVRDTFLTLLGLIARALGKVWLVVAWSGPSVFCSVMFEMFSRFPATGLRSLIASNVRPNHRGGAFAVVGVLEGGCNLAAAFVFHTLFPWSLSFMPQLSFLIMAALIVPPTILIWCYRRELDNPIVQNEYSMSDDVE